MNYNFLSGGTGTPKLLEGFRTEVHDENIRVICNSGDDLNWYGLRVCPDLDTVLYLFSGKLDVDKFWGRTNDTFHTLQSLKEIEKNQWFNVGDQDIALHLYRTKSLRHSRLTNIIADLCESWGIKSTILPMSDSLVQTIIHGEKQNYSFQEYFVKMRTEVNVQGVSYQGDTIQVPKEVLNLFDGSPLIIGPSNPITSIGPIFAMKQLYTTICHHRKNNIAISPLRGDVAYSGPTAKLMKTMGFEVSPIGIARYYQDSIGTLIIDDSDSEYIEAIEDLEMEVICLDTSLHDTDQKSKLAKEILNIL